jgi:hypothetical protein
MLITQFCYSDEFENYMISQFGANTTRPENNLVNDFYRGILGRLPDDGGFNAWLQQMREAQCAGADAVKNLSYQIAESFVQSAEYNTPTQPACTQYTEDLYNAILRRGADCDGFNDWVQQCEMVDRLSILKAFTDSPEFQTRVIVVIDAGCAPNPQIAVAGGIAVVTDQSSPDNKAHLQVININNLNEPLVLGELDTNIPAFYGVALNNTATMAVVAAGYQGIIVVDLRDPARPVVIGIYDTPGCAYGVTLNSAGTIAYVADGTAGLMILNLSNPRSPSLIGSLPTSGVCNDVELSGSVACLLNQQGSMQTVDVTNPSAPVIKGTIGLNGAGHAIAVDNNEVAVLSQTTNDLLEIIDITNPEQPVAEGYAVVTSQAGTAKGIDLANGVACVAAGSEGLKCYTIGSAPLLHYIVPVPGGAYDVTVNGNYAYVTGNPAKVSIIDLDLPY